MSAPSDEEACGKPTGNALAARFKLLHCYYDKIYDKK